MTRNVTLQDRVASAAAELVNPVWEAQSIALGGAIERCHGPVLEYPPIVSMMARALFREHLEAAGLPQGWRIDGNKAKLAQTMIVGNGMCLRYLKERREHGAPPAGRNPARRAFWQPSLLVEQPSLFEGQGEPLKLLLLWDWAEGQPGSDAEGGFVMRIVHTTDPGAWEKGRHPKLDLSIDLAPGLGLESGLEFPAEAEETDFFAAIDEQEREQGDGA